MEVNGSQAKSIDCIQEEEKKYSFTNIKNVLTTLKLYDKELKRTNSSNITIFRCRVRRRFLYFYSQKEISECT